MSDFRSLAEEFVIAFVKYVDKYDIKDEFNKRTQKMEMSPGVAALIKQAKAVFPRAEDGAEGKKLTDQMTDDEVTQAITPNVIDSRAIFARKLAKNGGTHALLRQLYNQEPGAMQRVAEFFEREDGLEQED